MSVSRASGKLEAALARFGLAGALRGARAIDVGASTGGFTATLLDAGAAHVLAVDVGRDQLHPSLRADPRVTSLEETDWRRLSLDVAEGPFDFFTVDVSFVAARNMLRGLAFRLRPGAEGVVLVKPQFELPPPRSGEPADDERRRRAAVDKVKAKAESLGFSLVATHDSPVPGAGGTIEVLAHLRFSGRPETLPRPGERRARSEKATSRSGVAARAGVAGNLRWFAVVAPGLEAAAARELAGIVGAGAPEVVAGGVEWDGPLERGFDANLWARIPTRIVARVGRVEAREFGQLRRRGAKLPWRTFVAPDSRLLVRASASRCRLYHTGALAENVVLAIADGVPGVRLAESPEAADGTVMIRGEEDRFLMSADASGERLHRRGARTEAGPAPLRETLAAGLLALAGWEPSIALLDPLCGTGTIPIEAAIWAADRAPGLDRPFALERWPGFVADARTVDAARRARDEALARVRSAALPAPIHGSDRDPRAVESARRNAERAGVGAQASFECRDFADASPPAPSGLVITNPPYGRRLGDPRGAGRVYRDLGRALRARFRGWRAAVLAPARLDLPALFALPASGQFPLTNGGLPVVLHVFEIR